MNEILSSIKKKRANINGKLHEIIDIGKENIYNIFVRARLGLGKERSEVMDEQMTDFQFRKLLEMVLAILRKSDNLEEAIKEIEKLAAKDSEN